MERTPRLLCVSLNPAIDRRIVLAQLRVGEVNRANSVDPAAGGKSAHVAFAAAALGARVRWLAFLGGPEGESCRAGVETQGVHPVVVKIAGRTRNTLEMIDASSGTITEVLEPGPQISGSERERFLDVFAEELSEHPIVVLSGSVPGGVGDSIYRDLVATAKQAGCYVVLDTSGEPLRMGLAAGPDVIKPNRQEMSALCDREIHTSQEAIGAARDLLGNGVTTVIVSLGADGAVVVEKTGVLRGVAPAVRAFSTVGSGDSFLAGWAVATAQGAELAERLRVAIACGTANCMAANPGVIERETVQSLLSRVSIQNQ